MSTPSDINANNIGVVGDNAYIEGNIIGAIYQESIDPDKYAFIEEGLADVMSDEFITPAHSQDIVQRILSNRFLLLSGKDRMGKAALARHIAHMLLKVTSNGLLVKKIRRNRDLSDILDILTSEKTQDYIVLGYDVDINEIQEHLDVLDRIARQNSKFIIFTSEASISNSIASRFQQYLVEVQAGYPYTSQNIETLLEQRFQSQDVELRRNIRNVTKKLASPSMAVRLTENLLKDTAIPEYNEWINRLNELEDASIEVKKWLSKLGKNERILFLILALFDDLPEHDFWIVYETVIEALKKRDHTLIELDYYALEENQEFIVSEPSIAFKDVEYRNVILSRLLKLNRRSLIKLLPLLHKQISERPYPDWQMRLATAEAVGHIGIVEWVAANQVLYAWAKHTNPSVRVAVGHTHRQMIKVGGDTILSLILREMSRYLKENTPERSDDTIQTMGPRWTVAASLGRINRYVTKDRFEQDVLPIFEKVYHDQHVEVRKAAVYSMRQIGLSRFNQIRPILAEKAKDHRVEVQLEVAETLAKLSLSNKSGIYQLLQEWLTGQDEDRLWTAFYTFYLLDSRMEDQFSILQQQIRENSHLRIKVANSLNNILTSNRLSDKNTVTLFNSIARRNDMSINEALLVQVLVVNVYKRHALAINIVNRWINDDVVSLNELAEVIRQRLNEYILAMQVERQRLLKHELDNNELLADFAAQLPEDEQPGFWNEVNIKREERKIRRQQLMKIYIGIGISGVVVITLCMCILLFNLLS